MKLLDCFCGLGGASEGFAREGFDCTGIDIVNVGYPYRFILADMQTLKGEDFRGYDVIWGSPPCRDFSNLARIYGHTWKVRPNPLRGLDLVNCFFHFVNGSQPRFWIMENVSNLGRYLTIKPRIDAYLSIGRNNQGKKHAFWGNFPLFLMPKDNRKKPIMFHKMINGKRCPKDARSHGKLTPWENAKIPLACSQAFARACKEALLEKELV